MGSWVRGRTTRTTIAVGALLATGLTACSGGGPDAEEDPQAAVSEAIEALGDYDGIELTFAVDGDADAIVASADGDLDEDDAALLLESSVVLRATGGDEDDGQAEVVVDLRGQEAFELRILPESQLFARLDVDAIGTAVDDPSLGQGLDQAVTMAEQFGLGDAAQALRNGDWIQVTGVEELAAMAGGGASEEPSEEEVEDVRDRLVGALQRFLDEDVELEHVGDEDAGERIRATADRRDLADLLEEVSSAAGDLGGVGGDQLTDLGTEELGEGPITVDLWLDGGRLSQVGFDLAEATAGQEGAAPEGTFVVARVAEFDGSIEPPGDPVEVDLGQVLGGMMGGFAGAGTPDGAVTDGAVTDGGDVPDGGATTDGGEGNVPSGDDCIPQAMVDAALEEEGGESLQSAIDQGLITVC